MAIVSVSLTDRNLEVLDSVKEIYGLKGRSEAIRACLRSAEEEVRDRDEMKGHVEGVLVVVHDSHESPDLDRTRHDYQEMITTQIHSHLRNHKCLEVFIVQGDSGRVKELIVSLRSDDSLDYVKFIQS